MRSTFCAEAALVAIVALVAFTAAAPAMSAQAAQKPAHRTFATPDAAVKALAEAVKASNIDEVLAIFAPDGQELAASSDPATAMQNREIFAVAFAEGWRLVTTTGKGANHKTLVIGNESWPFPVPLVKEGSRWRFDTAAGKEEVLARRIGRNELAVIAVCKTYVSAQMRYAADGHDGKPAGVYAQVLRSDPGKQNGLYWPETKGAKRSPLGDLVAEAAQEGQALAEQREPAAPFHGYYFKMLKHEGGFALVAWPAFYDASGVMTFLVAQDGVVQQKDLGPDTAAAVKAMTAYHPDASWTRVK